MTVNMASTDEAARGVDDLRRCAEVERVIQAGSAGGSHEQGETESEDGNRKSHRRGTRANNGKGRSLKSRTPKHKRSSCEEGSLECRENWYRRETHWEATGLEVPGALDTSAGTKDVGDNGLGKMVSAKEIAQSSQDISGGRRSIGVAHWRSNSYTVHPKAEKSNTKSSPRISTPKTTLAARTACHPVEKGTQQRSPSTVLAEPVSRRRERKSENRLLCQTRGVEDGDQHVMERKQQAKRLALEIAKLRSALRVSNSDLAAERKVRARLEDDRWEQAQAWGHERGVIVSAKQEADRALQAAQEELAALRKQAKVQASAHEVSLLKTESALNRVIKVQDRLVQALQTEVDLTNRARSAAQVDANKVREQLHQCERDFRSWRGHAKLLEGQMDKLGHPLPLQRDPGGGHVNEACLEDVQGFVNKATGGTLQNRFDDGRHPPVSKGPEITTAIPEACSVNTNEAMASSTELSDLKDNFERSMRAQQEISTRIEKELARARADLITIYGCNGSKKDATDAVIIVASPEDRNDPGFFTDIGRKGPGRKGDDCDGGTNHNVEVEVPGPHSARVLAALLGLKTSGAESGRRNLGGKACRTAAGVAGVVQSSSKPHLRLSDYPPQIQAIFRREPPPLIGVPTPISDKIATPRLYQPPGGSRPQAAAAQEKRGAASFVARSKPKEGCSLVGAFREYEPKSPMLRMWLTEKSSPASPPDKEK